MTGKLGGKIMKKFVGLRVKTCSYLADDSSEDKKAKGTKVCHKKIKIVIKTIKNMKNIKTV